MDGKKKKHKNTERDLMSSSRSNDTVHNKLAPSRDHAINKDQLSLAKKRPSIMIIMLITTTKNHNTTTIRIIIRIIITKINNPKVQGGSSQELK